MEFIGVTGEPRPTEDIEAALLWVKKKIVRVDVSDPEGVMHALTIKDALTELLFLRKAIESARARNKSAGGPPP
jgi:hypothetical protein